MNDFEKDFEQVMYNLHNRIEKEHDNNKEHDEEKNIKIYNDEKMYMIKNYEKRREYEKIHDKNKNYNDYDECLNYHFWDICFASSYDFPKNKMGFRGQWYLPKLKPFVNYLKNLSHIENVHMCYKKITETNCLTLEKFFYWVKPVECENCVYNEKRCEYCHYLDYSLFPHFKIDETNFISKLTNKEHNNFVFDDFEFVIDCLDDVHHFKTHKLPFIKENQKENTLIALNLLEKHFSDGFPFFTLYLPENIQKMDEIITIKDDGNFCEIIAKSKDYFYYFQQTN